MALNRKKVIMKLEKYVDVVRTESRAIKEVWQYVDDIEVILSPKSSEYNKKNKGDGLAREEIYLIGIIRGLNLESGKYRFIAEGLIYEVVGVNILGNKNILHLKTIKEG